MVPRKWLDRGDEHIFEDKRNQTRCSQCSALHELSTYIKSFEIRLTVQSSGGRKPCNPDDTAGQRGQLKVRRVDRFGNHSLGGAGGVGLAVTGHGPGRLDATVHDCGDGTTDIRLDTN